MAVNDGPLTASITTTPGLVAGPNASKIPGALKRAVNVAVVRENIIETRRGTRQIASSTDLSSQVPDWVFQYNQQLFVVTTALVIQTRVAAPTLGGGALSSGVWTGFGTLTSEGTGISSQPTTAEMNRVCYLASMSPGRVWKLDGTSGATVYVAGLQRCPDPIVTAAVAATGWLAANNIVGYRVVFGRRDLQGNYNLGPPSGRIVLTNGGSAANATVKTFIPTEIIAAPSATQASYYYQVYRTPAVASGDPGDEGRLVYQAYLTSTDIANLYVSFTDIYPETANKGPQLYTNASQQGADKAGHQPPACYNVAAFKGAMFYGDCFLKGRLSLTMLGIPDQLVVSTGAGGFTFAGGNVTVTFTGAPDLTGIPTDSSAQLSISDATSAGNIGTFAITAVNNGASTITCVNAGGVTEAGKATSRGMATKLTIGGRTYYASFQAEAPASNRYNATVAGSASQQIAGTSQSLCRIIVQDTGQTHCWGYYAAGPDDAPGQILLEEMSPSATFTAQAFGTSWTNKWSPTLGASVSCDQQQFRGRLYFSKYLTPEQVPLGQYFDIGSVLAPIRRIVPLRDSLLVFKDDGLFRIYGDGATWSVYRLDDRVGMGSWMRAAVATLHNHCYAVTSAGILDITDISYQPIDSTIATLAKPFFEVGAFTALNTASVSYKDNSVFFYFSGAGTGAATATLGLSYNAQTGAWTQFDPSTSTFGVSTYGGTTVQGMTAFVLGSGSNKYLAVEALNGGNAVVGEIAVGSPLPADRFLVTISAVNGGASQVTYAATQGLLTPAVGDYIQGNTGMPVLAGMWKITNVAGFVLTLAAGPGATTVAADFAATTTYSEVYRGISTTVEYHPFSAGDDHSVKRWLEVSPQLDQLSTASSLTVGVYTDLNATEFDQTTPSAIDYSLRTIIDADHRRAGRLSAIVKTNSPITYMLLRGMSYTYLPDPVSRDQ